MECVRRDLYLDNDNDDEIVYVKVKIILFQKK